MSKINHKNKILSYQSSLMGKVYDLSAWVYDEHEDPSHYEINSEVYYNIMDIKECLDDLYQSILDFYGIE